MRTATFIEQSSKDRNIAQMVRKEVRWQPHFGLLKEGDVFTAEFGEGGRTMDFRIVKIISQSDDIMGFEDTRTFYMEFVQPVKEIEQPDIDDIPF